MEWPKLISSRIQTSSITFDGLKLSTWSLGALVMPLDVLVGKTDACQYGQGHSSKMDQDGSIFDLMQRPVTLDAKTLGTRCSR